MEFDIIGDVHGHATHLKGLLIKLGYSENDSVWFHPNRKAIFCGDFIDRGPEIVETFEIVMNMCKAETAYAIIGNHEFALMVWHSFKGQDLLKPDFVEKSGRMCKSTRLAFKEEQKHLKEYMKWLRTVPMYLELDGFRIVHAAWSDEAISKWNFFHQEEKLKKSKIRSLVLDHQDTMKALSFLLNGPKMVLPSDMKIYCNHGLNRKEFRIKWWIKELPNSFKELCFEGKFSLPDYTIPKELLPEIETYNPSAPLVFCGHYCRAEGAQILSNNVVCVDSCISYSSILTAYQQGEGQDVGQDHLITFG
ncbi:metallophosphoesterase [Halosquirtibacter laminarini]|uniref:Metallophosphoesterase n=1 Tax=Halosquirtibacter laminarini TaxID=3374600 RepID=A0AC61NNS6_9BACT|nr:metallophosphoesterase [Prolixibacteraceae bacterium]